MSTPAAADAGPAAIHAPTDDGLLAFQAEVRGTLRRKLSFERKGDHQRKGAQQRKGETALGSEGSQADGNTVDDQPCPDEAGTQPPATAAAAANIHLLIGRRVVRPVRLLLPLMLTSIELLPARARSIR